MDTGTESLAADADSLLVYVGSTRSQDKRKKEQQGKTQTRKKSGARQAKKKKDGISIADQRRISPRF